MMPQSRRIVLRGGTVIDGLRQRTRAADVAIVGDRITGVGTIDAKSHDTVIDCTGRLVMPGLIDTHAHLEGAIFTPDVQRAMLRQGVTSVITGQDGVSYAPGSTPWATQYFAAINGPHPHLTTTTGDPDADTTTDIRIRDLLATYDGTTAVNVGTLVPAGNVRHAVMGMDTGRASARELNTMKRMVKTGLADGALGLSTGLDYVPGLYADAEEISRLCEPVAAAGAVYVTHMRGGYEANSEFGIREVARIMERTGVRGHISHFHVHAAEGRKLLSELAAAGHDVTFDMYPYTRGCTLLAMALLPPEYSALDVNDAVEKLKSQRERQRLQSEWFPQVAKKASLGPAWPSMITIAHAPHLEWMWTEGLTLEDIARRIGATVVDTVLDLLIELRLEVSAVMAVRDQRPDDDLAKLFSHDAFMGGSDGIVLGGSPHPRAYGAFARFLSTFVGRSFTWAGAAIHLSGRPAQRFGLGDRGAVRPGWIADIAIVDPTGVRDEATYDNPRQPASGIDDVLVAGEVVLSNGELTGELSGRGLRRTGAAR
ncbi:N-acyl-D-amino-acid deacylase family protein [Demequina sediminicola]|uniref:N-acyl-D-amino-acid deacylase family protein n=1 Tax=Demequina sediminicola TaxID=1095026 RepID=UPI0007849228|nr:amidohydrolase family protein [Demequina sediminicola]